jgi:hypothetical protein
MKCDVPLLLPPSVPSTLKNVELDGHIDREAEKELYIYSGSFSIVSHYRMDHGGSIPGRGKEIYL